MGGIRVGAGNPQMLDVFDGKDFVKEHPQGNVEVGAIDDCVNKCC